MPNTRISILAALAFVFAAIVLVVVFFFNPFGGGDANSEEVMAENVEIVDVCDRPDSFFDIHYQNHTGGFVIDDGLPTDPVAALEKIVLVTAQDPKVLRYFTNDILAARFGDKFGEIPEERDLMILATRKEEWQRLCQFLTDETVLIVVVELEGEIGNHVMDANGEVVESIDQVSPGEQGIAIVVEGYKSNAVVLRAICSNLITKNPPEVSTPTPGREVPPNTPAITSTPPVVNTGTPPAINTPTNTPTGKPTATPTPKNTPPNVPTPTNTPRNTSTTPPQTAEPTPIDIVCPCPTPSTPEPTPRPVEATATSAPIINPTPTTRPPDDDDDEPGFDPPGDDAPVFH